VTGATGLHNTIKSTRKPSTCHLHQHAIGKDVTRQSKDDQGRSRGDIMLCLRKSLPSGSSSGCLLENIASIADVLTIQSVYSSSISPRNDLLTLYALSLAFGTSLGQRRFDIASNFSSRTNKRERETGERTIKNTSYKHGQVRERDNRDRGSLERERQIVETCMLLVDVIYLR
jgi:hypothetical protein